MEFLSTDSFSFLRGLFLLAIRGHQRGFMGSIVFRRGFFSYFALWVVLAVSALSAQSPENVNARRLGNNSPWFALTEADLGFYSSQSGFVPETGDLEVELGISPKMFEMIESATNFILASVFLFDNMYPGRTPEWSLAERLTEMLIQKKLENPEMPIAIILDPLHKSYASRVSPMVQRLTAAGVDIFYSDRLTTSAIHHWNIIEGAAEVFRSASQRSTILGGALRSIGQIPVPVPRLRNSRLQLLRIDGHLPQIQSIFRGLLIKANHRKLLVTGSESDVEALVSSANAHDGSLPSNNSAISVKGEMAKFIYTTLREDVRHSLSLGEYFVDWGSENPDYQRDYLKTTLRPLRASASGRAALNRDTAIRGKFVTESEIKYQIIELLRSVQPGDKIRLQMFYLSDIDVIHAILDAAHASGETIEILLDPNEGAFNKVKDGTPNRQVAEYMLTRARIEGVPDQIEIRWAHSRTRDGVQEVRQNHAKTMSISNELSGKAEMITGSANWTRKNLGDWQKDINMESDIVILGARKLVDAFNGVFDRMFRNSRPGVVYSIDYADPEYAYHLAEPRSRWAKQSLCSRLMGQMDRRERPILRERSLVSW